MSSRDTPVEHHLNDRFPMILGNLLKNLDSFIFLTLGHQPSTRLWQNEGHHDYGDHLSVDCPVECFPVCKILGQPGLRHATESESHGQTEITNQGSLVDSNILKN